VRDAADVGDAEALLDRTDIQEGGIEVVQKHGQAEREDEGDEDGGGHDLGVVRPDQADHARALDHAGVDRVDIQDIALDDALEDGVVELLEVLDLGGEGLVLRPIGDGQAELGLPGVDSLLEGLLLHGHGPEAFLEALDGHLGGQLQVTANALDADHQGAHAGVRLFVDLELFGVLGLEAGQLQLVSLPVGLFAHHRRCHRPRHSPVAAAGGGRGRGLGGHLAEGRLVRLQAQADDLLDGAGAELVEHLELRLEHGALHAQGILALDEADQEALVPGRLRLVNEDASFGEELRQLGLGLLELAVDVFAFRLEAAQGGVVGGRQLGTAQVLVLLQEFGEVGQGVLADGGVDADIEHGARIAERVHRDARGAVLFGDLAGPLVEQRLADLAVEQAALQHDDAPGDLLVHHDERRPFAVAGEAQAGVLHHLDAAGGAV